MSTTSQPHRRRFAGLDGLRALGALGVLSTHVGFQSGDSLNGPYNGLLARLDVGVALFFVISGFLLYRPHALAQATGKRLPGTRAYLWHRALRILPALWIAIILAAVLLPHDASIDGQSYLRHALLIQIYFENHQVAGLTQMWSLATEVAFYLMLPLLARALSKIGLASRRAVVHQLLALGTFLLIGPLWMAGAALWGSGRQGLWLPGYIGWFGVGMALSVWHVARSSGLIRPGMPDVLARYPGTVWAGAIAVFGLAISPLAGPYDLTAQTPGEAATKNVLYALFGLLVVFPAVAALHQTDDTPPMRFLGGRAGHFFGDVSYGVFVYHLVVLRVVEQQTRHTLFTGQFATLFWLTLLGAVALAALSYRFVERPLMRWGRRDRRYDVSPDAGPTEGVSADAVAGG